MRVATVFALPCPFLTFISDNKEKILAGTTVINHVSLPDISVLKIPKLSKISK